MKKHLKTTWAHIRRSPYQALAAIGIMTLTFFVVSVIVLTAFSLQTILHYFETRPQITAFFKDEATDKQVEELKKKLDQTGKVKEMKYISKEEALKIYREQNKNEPLLLEMVTASILPASLEIATIDLTYLNEVAQIVTRLPEIEEVVFQEDIVRSLQRWTQTIRKVGAALIMFLALFSLLIVLVIIGMKVALRKYEIEIMHLIGAKKSYIRIPFVLEGIFYGGMGAFLGWVISLIILLYSTPILIEFLAGIPLLPFPFSFLIILLAGEIFAGILIGILGSLLAVSKYLK